MPRKIVWIRDDELRPEDGIPRASPEDIARSVRLAEERQRCGIRRMQEAQYAHLAIRWALEKLADIRALAPPERTRYEKLYKSLDRLPEGPEREAVLDEIFAMYSRGRRMRLADAEDAMRRRRSP